MPFNPRWLIGRTITAVEMNPFPRGDGFPKTPAHNPTITLDNGAKIRFHAEETEDIYGVDIVYIPAL